MKPSWLEDLFRSIRTTLLSILWIVPVAMAVGSACALFLWSLDLATAARFEHPWLLYGLPLAGLLMGLAYHRWGTKAEAGNNLIFDQIHETDEGVPRRMAPMVLVATVLTLIIVPVFYSIIDDFQRWCMGFLGCFKRRTPDESAGAIASD